MNERWQLSIFLTQVEVKNIEGIRSKYNPIQHDLIPAHITLARETEFLPDQQFLRKFKEVEFPRFQVGLGKAERFSEGKGVFIPIRDPEHKLTKLRALLRIQSTDFSPHITIMHPRNATCTDEIFEDILKVKIPGHVQISNIKLIRQQSGERWEVMGQINFQETFHLLGTKRMMK